MSFHWFHLYTEARASLKAAELAIDNKDVKDKKETVTTQSTMTQTTRYESEQSQPLVSNDSFQYPDQPSPPQTYPQDLRVDTRIKVGLKKIFTYI